MKLWCWRCEVCGYEWMVKYGVDPQTGYRKRVVPAQCPSGECRARNWNGGEKRGRGRPRKNAVIATNATDVAN